MRIEHDNTSSIGQRDLEEAIVAYVMAKTPNGLQRRHIYNNFNHIDADKVDQAIDNMVEQDRLVKGFNSSNASLKFKKLLDEHGNEIIHLGEYTGNEPVNKTTQIGSSHIPRLLDNTRLAAEDVNQLIEAVAVYQNTVKADLEEEVGKKIDKIYAQMIGIFGVFVSIFAILVISTDKMLRFDPSILDKYSFWDLLIKSTALFIPVGIVIALLILVVMRSRK
jgi:hypothetical protein